MPLDCSQFDTPKSSRETCCPNTRSGRRLRRLDSKFEKGNKRQSMRPTSLTQRPNQKKKWTSGQHGPPNEGRPPISGRVRSRRIRRPTSSPPDPEDKLENDVLPTTMYQPNTRSLSKCKEIVQFRQRWSGCRLPHQGLGQRRNEIHSIPSHQPPPHDVHPLILLQGSFQGTRRYPL